MASTRTNRVRVRRNLTAASRCASTWQGWRALDLSPSRSNCGTCRSWPRSLSRRSPPSSSPRSSRTASAPSSSSSTPGHRRRPGPRKADSAVSRLRARSVIRREFGGVICVRAGDIRWSGRIPVESVELAAGELVDRLQGGGDDDGEADVLGFVGGAAVATAVVRPMTWSEAFLGSRSARARGPGRC
jgi:hypothetical protein